MPVTEPTPAISSAPRVRMPESRRSKGEKKPYETTIAGNQVVIEGADGEGGGERRPISKWRPTSTRIHRQ